MQIIEFNGLGEPKDPRVTTGTIVLLVHESKISIVRVELLPPEQFGPSLEHAKNEALLESLARIAISNAFPNGLDADRHWTIECPPEIAAQALFPDSPNSSVPQSRS